MPIILVNPLDETPRNRARAAPRLASMAGRTIGLLDISKPGGKIFLNYVERELKERYGVLNVVRQTKPTFTKLAPHDVIRRILDERCDAVVEALAD